MSADRLVFLVVQNTDTASVLDCEEIGGYKVTEGAMSERDSVLYYTYTWFNGCEEDAAILPGFGPINTYRCLHCL